MNGSEYVCELRMSPLYVSMEYLANGGCDRVWPSSKGTSITELKEPVKDCNVCCPKSSSVRQFNVHGRVVRSATILKVQRLSWKSLKPGV